MDQDKPIRPESFEEFWPEYLNAHSDLRRRLVHVAATAIGLGFAVAFLFTLDPLWAVAAVVFSYGAAWIAHAIFQHNVPATFSHPLWSLRGDMRMLRLALSGRLTEEAGAIERRTGVVPKKRVYPGT